MIHEHIIISAKYKISLFHIFFTKYRETILDIVSTDLFYCIKQVIRDKSLVVNFYQ